MVLAGNDRRAYDELLKGEIGHFRSEVGLDNRMDMVSSNWLPIFLYYTTDRLFKTGFQKKLAIITLKELVKLPYANPHYILPITKRRSETTTTTPIQLAVSSIDGEYGIEALKCLLSIDGCKERCGVMVTSDGYTALEIAKLRNIPKMIELLDELNMGKLSSNNNILKRIYNNNTNKDEERQEQKQEEEDDDEQPYYDINMRDDDTHNDNIKDNNNNNKLQHRTRTSSTSTILADNNIITTTTPSSTSRSRVTSSSSSSPSYQYRSSGSSLHSCCICKDDDDNNNNTYNGLVKCDKCNRYAHKTCYKGFIIKGGSMTQKGRRHNKTSTTTRICLSCRAGSSLPFKCGICNMDDNKGSLMVYRSDLPGQFVHLRCSLFLKPDRLRQDALYSNDKLQIIGNLVKIGRRRHCYICSKPGGFRCGYPGCSVRYHITCLDNNNNDCCGYGGYKRIIRGPGKKITVNNNIAMENFERMTKCSHSYLRIYCSRHINDNLCICGERITNDDKENNRTMDCSLKGKGCVYGTLHRKCIFNRMNKEEEELGKEGVINNRDDEPSTAGPSSSCSCSCCCPHCEFCISSSGKLPLGPCLKTCIYCNYAYRDRIISSDEESDGEELGINDNIPHKAVLPKHRPANDNNNNTINNDNKRRKITTTTRETTEDRKIDIEQINNKKSSSSSIDGINNNVVKSIVDVKVCEDKSSLKELIKECIDEVLVPWLLIDILQRNSINNIDDLMVFLSTPRLSFIIPERIRHDLQYKCTTILHKEDDACGEYENKDL